MIEYIPEQIYRFLSSQGPDAKYIWRQRVSDIKLILDHLKEVENRFPGLLERLNTSCIAAVGHSFGAHTVGLLLGARVTGPDGHLEEDMSDKRIKAAVLLSAGGRGGDALSELPRRTSAILTKHLINPGPMYRLNLLAQTQ